LEEKYYLDATHVCVGWLIDTGTDRYKKGTKGSQFYDKYYQVTVSHHAEKNNI